MTTKFAERLAELKKTFDVFPWIEVLKLGPAPNSAVATGGFTFLGSGWKRPYSMLLREFRLLPISVYIAGATAADVVVTEPSTDFLYEFAQVKQSSQAGLVHAMLGTPEKGWHGFGDGLYLPKDDAIDFVITTRGEVQNQGYVYLAGVGYRLYPKGTISPVQHTAEEHRHSGYRLIPFSFVKRIDLAGTEVKYSADLLFNEHFLLDGIRTSVRGFGDDGAPGYGFLAGIAANLEIEITADRTIMSDPANRFVVAGHHDKNDWQFEEPITIENGTRWHLETQIPHVAGIAALALAPAVQLEIVFHGHKLVKLKGK